jgi:hypothetical protein
MRHLSIVAAAPVYAVQPRIRPGRCGHGCASGVRLSGAKMRKLATAFFLFTSPAVAQTPNLSPGPAMESIGSPAKCLPIGKTAKGELVYAMDCRDLPLPGDGNSNLQRVAPNLPSGQSPPAASR